MPMIRLKSVKTLPATMLETDRLEVSGGSPSSCSRRCASEPDSPCSIAASVIGLIYSGPRRRGRGAEQPPGEYGFSTNGTEARTQPRLLGDRAPGARRGPDRQGRRAARL